MIQIITHFVNWNLCPICDPVSTPLSHSSGFKRKRCPLFFFFKNLAVYYNKNIYFYYDYIFLKLPNELMKYFNENDWNLLLSFLIDFVFCKLIEIIFTLICFFFFYFRYLFFHKLISIYLSRLIVNDYYFTLILL